MKKSIPITTLIIIGILVYILITSQNKESTEENTNNNTDSDKNTTNNTNKYGQTQKETNPLTGETTDKVQEAAISIGKQIGNHSWPSSKNELADAKEGWQSAAAMQRTLNTLSGARKNEYKIYITYLISSCKENGSKHQSFQQRYEHLTSSHGDISGITQGAEWKKIWKTFDNETQTLIKQIKSFADSKEYSTILYELDT